MNIDPISHFTGREKEIAAFENLTGDQSSIRIMLVDGFSGTGKSFLLDWLRRYKCENIPTAKIMLSRSLHEVQLLGQIAAQVHPESGKRFSSSIKEETQKSLIEYAPSLSMEAQKKGSIEQASQTAHLNLSIESGFGDIIKVEKRTRRFDMLVDALIPLTDKTWILFIDQTEYLADTELGYFFQSLILRLNACFPKFRAYLTGQSVPVDWFSRHEQFKFSLESFSLEETKDFLSKTGIDKDELQECIFNATDGHPLLVNMLIEDYMEADGNYNADILSMSMDDLDEQARTKWIYERVVDRLEDPLLRRLAANLSLFEWFDLSLLRKVFSEEILESSFRELVRRSFIKKLAGKRWQCHEIIRKHLRPHRKQLDPVEYTNIHGKIFEALASRIQLEEESYGDLFFPDRLEYSSAALNSSSEVSASSSNEFLLKEITFGTVEWDADYLFGLVRFIEKSHLIHNYKSLIENTRILLEALNLWKPDARSLGFIKELSEFAHEINELWASDTLLFVGAWFSFSIGDLERARNFAQRAVDNNNNIENNAFLIEILVLSGAIDDAIETLDRALSTFGDCPELHLSKAEIALASDDIKTAIEHYAEIIATYPEDCNQARLKLAGILIENEEFDGALTQLQTVLESDPMNPDALVMRSEILFSTGKINQAMNHAKDLANLLPQITQQMAPLMSLLADPLVKPIVLADLTYESKSVSIDLFITCLISLAVQGDVENTEKVAKQVELRWPEAKDLAVCYKGLSLSVSGKFEESISLLEPLTKLPTPIIDAYIGLANSYGEKGEMRRQREILRALSERVPSLQDLVDQLMARSFAKEQGPSAALKYLQEEAKQRSIGPFAELAQVECHLAMGGLESIIEAREILERIIYTQGVQTLPVGSLISSRVLFATLLIQTEDFERARKIAVELIEGFPGIQDAALSAATIFTLLRDEKNLRKMLAEETSNSILYLEIMGHLATIIQAREPTVEGLLAELERYPNRLEILLAIDILMTSTGQLDSFKEFAPRIEEISPGLIGHYQHFQGKFQQIANPKMEAQLRMQKEQYPDDPSIRIALSRALEAMGKIDEAILELNELAERNSDFEEFRIQKTSEFLLKAGRIEDAERLLAPYMDLDPPPELVANAIWHLLVSKDDDDQRIKFAERMEDYYPYFMEIGFEEAFEKVFEEMYEKGDYENLLAFTETYLNNYAKEAPDEPLPAEYLLWKSKALNRLGKSREALEVIKPLEERQDLSPNSSVEVFSAKGDVLKDLEDFEASAEAYIKSTEIDPWNKMPYLRLKDLYKIQEKWGDAFEVLKQAVAMSPSLACEYESELRELKDKKRCADEEHSSGVVS